MEKYFNEIKGHDMKITCILFATLLLFILPSNAKGEWKTYHLTKGDFSLYMPQKPSKKVSKQKAAKGLVRGAWYRQKRN